MSEKNEQKNTGGTAEVEDFTAGSIAETLRSVMGVKKGEMERAGETIGDGKENISLLTKERVLREKERSLEEKEKNLETKERGIRQEREKLAAEQERFREEKEAWESARKRVIKELRAMEEELREAEKRLRQREKDIAEKEKQLADALEKAEALGKLEKKLEEKEKQLYEKERELSEKEQVLREREKDWEKAERALSVLAEENHALAEKIKDMEKDMGHLRGILREKEEVIAEKESQIRSLEEAVANLKKEIGQKKEEVDSLRQKKEELAGENETLREALEKMKKEARGIDVIQRLKERVDDLEKQRKALEEEKKQYMLEVERLQKRLQRQVIETGHRISPPPAPTPASAPAVEIGTPPDTSNMTYMRNTRWSGKRQRHEPPDQKNVGWEETGDDYLARGNLASAIYAYRQAISEIDRKEDGDEGEKTRVRIKMARALLLSHRYEQAFREVGDILENVGRDLKKGGEGLYAGTVRLSPGEKGVLGEILLANGKTEGVIVFLRSAVEDVLSSPEKWGDYIRYARLLAASLYNTGEKEEALEVLSRYLEHRPDDRKAWKLKSRILWDMGRYPESTEALRMSIKAGKK